MSNTEGARLARLKSNHQEWTIRREGTGFVAINYQRGARIEGTLADLEHGLDYRHGYDARTPAPNRKLTGSTGRRPG